MDIKFYNIFKHWDQFNCPYLFVQYSVNSALSGWGMWMHVREKKFNELQCWEQQIIFCSSQSKQLWLQFIHTHKKNPQSTLNMCQALEFQNATLTSIMDRVVWCFLIWILDFCVTFPAIKMVSVWYGLLAAHFTFTEWILHRNIFTEDKKNLSQKYYSKILCIETIPEQISFDTYKLTKRVFN